jgi:hypothetical protein
MLAYVSNAGLVLCVAFSGLDETNHSFDEVFGFSVCLFQHCRHLNSQQATLQHVAVSLGLCLCSSQLQLPGWADLAAFARGAVMLCCGTSWCDLLALILTGRPVVGQIVATDQTAGIRALSGSKLALSYCDSVDTVICTISSATH